MKRHVILFLIALLLTTNAAFALFCTQCGQSLPTEANFCSACGRACREASTLSDTPQVPVTAPSSPVLVQPVAVVPSVITNDPVPAYLVTSPYPYLNSQRLDRHHSLQVLEIRDSQARVMFASKGNPYQHTTCWITVGDLERHTNWRPHFRVMLPIPAPFCITRSPKRRHVHAPIVINDHKQKHRHEKHQHHPSSRLIFKL